MSEDIKTLERKALYKEVWSQPMSKLGPKYGISDVGLKKICKKLYIPTPPRGYWAKVQNNATVRKTPLPRLKKGQPDSYTIQSHDRVNRKQEDIEEKLSDEAQQIITAISSGKPITVFKRLASPHPLVVKTREILSDSEIDQYGILIGDWKRDHLDIRVSPDSLRRALRIFDAIIKYFKKKDYEVEIEKKDRERLTFVRIFNEKVPFYIREASKRFDHQLTAEEKKELKRWSHSYAPKYDYHPTGNLVLNADGYWARGIKNKWADGKKNRVEDQLQEIICNVIKIADQKRTRRIEAIEQERQWEIERQRQAELRRLREIEMQRRADLEQQAENWVKSRQLREYIQAVEGEASKKGISKVSDGRYAFWLRWAKSHADRLDPLSKAFKFDDKVPEE